MVVYFCLLYKLCTNFAQILHQLCIQLCIQRDVFVRWCNCKIRMNRGHVIRILIFSIFQFKQERSLHAGRLTECSWLDAVHTFHCWRRRPSRPCWLPLSKSLLEPTCDRYFGRICCWKFFKRYARPQLMLELGRWYASFVNPRAGRLSTNCQSLWASLFESEALIQASRKATKRLATGQAVLTIGVEPECLDRSLGGCVVDLSDIEVYGASLATEVTESNWK